MSGTLYLSGEEHCRLLNDVYTRFSHTNPMHADVFPSIRQMELEVLAMTASMVGGMSCCLSLVKDKVLALMFSQLLTSASGLLMMPHAAYCERLVI